MNKSESFKNFLPYLVLLFVVGLVFGILNFQGQKINELETGELKTQLKNDKVTEITVMPKSDESIYYVTGKLEGYKENETFSTKVISSELESILNSLLRKGLRTVHRHSPLLQFFNLLYLNDTF